MENHFDSRAKFDSDWILIQTDTYYEPGDLITGNIYLRCDAKQLNLKIKGKEIGFWLEHHTKRIEVGEHSGDHHYTIPRLSKTMIFQSASPCFIFPPQGLIPGDFVIPFQFKLPQDLPASLYYRDPSNHFTPLAKIRYSVKAYI